MEDRVTAFARRLEKYDVNMHGFILSVKDKEVAKAYYHPFSEGKSHRLYSVSKTLTGIAVGMLIDDGKISLEDPIVCFFPDWLQEQPDPRLMRLTIFNMLRMSTCYRATVYREGVDENWSKPFFTSVPTHESGSVFFYDTGCAQVLSTLVRRISGEEVIDFLERRLFKPLGLTDKRYWLRDPSGQCTGGTGLCMSLRDMHKIAVCILKEGMGMIPQWYIREMGKKQIDTFMQTHDEEKYGYGWQCWRTRAGFAMYGMGGQLAVICPEKETVLSTIADTRLDPEGVQKIYDAFFEEIYPYLEEVSEYEPVSLSLNVQAVPDSAQGMAKSELFVFPDGNPLQLKNLCLKDDCLYYENSRGKVSLPFGRGVCRQISFPGWPDVPALCSGGWAGEDVLHIRCHAVGDSPCGFEMLVHFQHDGVTVVSRKSNDVLTAGYEGVVSSI